MFERDGYRCRWCSLPVVSSRTFTKHGLLGSGFDPPLGPDRLRTLGTDTTKHVVRFGLVAVADHKKPQALEAYRLWPTCARFTSWGWSSSGGVTSVASRLLRAACAEWCSMGGRCGTRSHDLHGVNAKQAVSDLRATTQQRF